MEEAVDHVTSRAVSTGIKRADRRLTDRPVADRKALLVLPAVICLLVFFLWPVIEVIHRSFTEPELGLGNYVRFFATDFAVRILATTVRTAVLVTLTCLVLGYPYAYLMNAAPPRLAGTLLIAVLLPLWSSLLVRTYAWQVILRDTGLINTFLIERGVVSDPIPLIRTTYGVLIGMTHILLPMMVLPIYAVMRRIDPEYGLAAANLGAPPLISFFRVFLPLSLPGVFAGSLLVFVVALGFYITPALLGGPRDTMISQLIADEVSLRLDWGYGGAMAALLLIVTLLTLGLAARAVRIVELFGGSAEE